MSQPSTTPPSAADPRAAFEQWFAGSQVTTDAGEPRAVYHGTYEEFSVFEGEEIYFAEDANTAADFGDQVMEVYLSIKNPLRYSYEDGPSMTRAQAIEAGHDGYVIEDYDVGDGDEIYPNEGDVWVAFHPEQIKMVAVADRERASSPVLPVAIPTVFHGTSQEFDEFAPNERGIFFSESRSTAESYVGVHRGPASRVIEAQLDIRNPWTYISYAATVPYRDQVDQSSDALKAQGYDGIHMPQSGVWVAFEPSQVRVLDTYEFIPMRQRAAGLERPRFSFSRDAGGGNGDPSTPFDFSQDAQFAHLFYGSPSATELKAFSSWLRSNPNAFVRLYHGTYAGHDVMEQGLLPTSANRRNSIQSSAGYVCLSAYPGMAYDFGHYASLNRPQAADGAKVAVYPVTMTIRKLMADLDQLANRRAFAGETVGNSLAESLVRARGARVRGKIDPVSIGAAQRFVARDVPVQEELEAVRYSFAGERARTADKSALALARATRTAGNAEQVRQGTGWFLGADGKWRFEIDDCAAAFLPAFDSIANGGHEARPIEATTYRVRDDGTYDLTLSPANPQRTTDFVCLVAVAREVVQAVVPSDVLFLIDAAAGEEDLIGHFEPARRIVRPFLFEGLNALPLNHVLHHPELFRAYPGIAQVMVKVTPQMGLGAAYKVFEEGVHAIELGAGMKLSNLTHELQHCIQGIEGFAAGGTVQSLRDRLVAQSDAGATGAATPEYHYMHLAGEVEARNVQTRKGFTAAERRARSPETTADVPADEQFVEFGDPEDALPMDEQASPAQRLRA